MSASFGMFTEFLHAHMKIYRNLTQDITKGQKGSKRVKKEVKIPSIQKNMIYPNHGMYECNFWHVYTIFTCAYDNLQEFDPKYNQGSKKGQNGSKKG